MSDCRHNPGREHRVGDVQTKGHQLDGSDKETIYKLVECLYGSDEMDIEAIDRYMGELDQIEEEPEEFDIENSLQQFHQRFDTAFEYRLEEVKPTRKRRPLARIAIIAAAMCTFIFTAQASGWDILGAIAQWTSEQFAYMTPGEVRGDRQEGAAYASLQNALDDCGVTEQLSPTRFPEGTEFSDIQVRQGDGYVLFSASYSLAGRTFYISAQSVTGAPYSEVEINNANLEIYVAGGIEHHIMADVKQRKAAWCNGNWECYIAGELSRHDLVLMIDSIYE